METKCDLCDFYFITVAGAKWIDLSMTISLKNQSLEYKQNGAKNAE